MRLASIFPIAIHVELTFVEKVLNTHVASAFGFKVLMMEIYSRECHTGTLSSFPLRSVRESSRIAENTGIRSPVDSENRHVG